MIPTLIIIHIIGAIITIFIQCKNGVMEYFSKNGDGIREPKPLDIIVLSCIAWE